MPERKKRILIVDDDQTIHLAAKYTLKSKYDCVSAYNSDEARVIAQNQPVDVVLLDLHMRRHEEGLECLPTLKEIDPDLDVIIVSGNTELDLAARAIKSGASAYLVKEHSADQLILTIESVLGKRAVLRENQHYVRDRKRGLEKNRVVGDAPAMRQLMKDVEKVRRSNANVIITAETGCGKELVARHLGAADGRPFVAVDAATITSTMAESILFGHERGAFTGAQAQAKGLFEEANGGTVYFDEIANMPLDIQAKLLRVIQEKEVTRLGSTKVIPLDFRVICATNKDLEAMVERGSFKDDLLQRLNVISLRIPPLRERAGDIPALVAHFFGKCGIEGSPTRVSDGAMEALRRYPWPGNVRELSNLIANLCTMVAGRDLVELEDLPAKIRLSERLKAPAHPPSEALPPPALGTPTPDYETFSLLEELSSDSIDFYQTMRSLEGRVLTQLYLKHGGNITQMSKTLRMSRSHLYSKLAAHQITV